MCAPSHSFQSLYLTSSHGLASIYVQVDTALLSNTSINILHHFLHNYNYEPTLKSYFVLIHKFSLTCLTTDSLFAKLSSFQLTPWSLHYLQQCRNYWLAILDSLFQFFSCFCSHFHTDQDGLLLFSMSKYTSSIKLKGSVFLIS